MALTKEELADVERLIARLRGLGMGFAACEPEELSRLERLAESSANAVWWIDPTLAREKSGAIDRHLRFVRACVPFARTMRALVEEEIAELPTRQPSTRDASSSSPAAVCGVCGKPRAEWSDTRPGQLGPDVPGVGHLCRADGAPIGGCVPGAPAAAKCSRCGARPGGQHTTPDPRCEICGRIVVEGHAPGCLYGTRLGG